MLSDEEIQKRFGKHKGTIEGPNPNEAAHAHLREYYSNMALYINDTLPDGRNKSLALTALEECSMWSHKAVANDS